MTTNKTSTEDTTDATSDVYAASPTRLKTGGWGVRINGGEELELGDICTVNIETKSGKTWDEEVRVIWTGTDKKGNPIVLGDKADGVDYQVAKTGVDAGTVSQELSDHATQLYQLLQNERDDGLKIRDSLLLVLAEAVWPELAPPHRGTPEQRQEVVEYCIKTGLHQQVGQPKLAKTDQTETPPPTAEIGGF